MSDMTLMSNRAIGRPSGRGADKKIKEPLGTHGASKTKRLGTECPYCRPAGTGRGPSEYEGEGETVGDPPIS